MPTIPLTDLFRLAASPIAHDLLGVPLGGGWVVTDLTGGQPDEAHPGALAHLAVVLVACGDPSHPLANAFDVVVADDTAAAQVVAAIDEHPIAATGLALLLRGADRRTVAEGLIAESAAYSALQGGPEHRAWLAGARNDQTRTDCGPRLAVTRSAGTLRITLTRPHVRNAYDAATRDDLLDALAGAASDPSVQVVIDGEGPVFSSGGDLGEFGTAEDPARAHLLRLARSTARALSDLGSRVTVHVRGACVGAGVELPAFAGRVIAHGDATFRLPEVSMGLVPGAGGTVSVPRRIGRHRAAWMAITGAPVDAVTAHVWGLVDDVVGG